MNKKRIRKIKDGTEGVGPVIYWMQRDQRTNDNWALIAAQKYAISKGYNLVVIFNLVTDFLEAGIRQYDFLLNGLKEVEKNLTQYNIPFILLQGDPGKSISDFVNKNNCAFLFTDMNPLKITRTWKEEIKKNITCSFYEVDAHNIVPVWTASNKLEFAAYTIRPKITKLLPEFLDEFPIIEKMEKTKNFPSCDWDKIYRSLKVNYSVGVVDWITPGETSAHKMLETFINNKIVKYASNRNDPNNDALSNLSPFLHFGQISAQRIALVISRLGINNENRKAFLEELIIRRELADNFCFYNNKYDSFEGFHDWAKKTLYDHRADKREYLYSFKQFKNAETHDNLWNAAQTEMITTGKMHGYMRMYWGKKILEWTNSPEEAMETAIKLNDKYELDGRDPNGYTGIAWSIGGVHDRAWAERPIFGKIRYMNYNGCKRKFDVAKYIKKFDQD